MKRTVLSIAAVVGLTGCAIEDAETLEARTYSAGCTRWQCGYNAADINGEPLSELNVNGLANASGMRIVGFISPMSLLGYTLTLQGDELVAKGGLLLGDLKGLGLIGSTILVKLGSGLVVPVLIAGVESVPSWADGGAPITAYTLVYSDLNNPLGQSNVCKGSLVEPLTSAVTFLGGETYDNATKTVHAGKTGWFTLACAGSAAAKMKLMNYGPNSDFDGAGHAATPLQRQATLKMITADYCGTGTSYTATGTPILWTNASQKVTPDPETPAGDFEAAWGPNGATCLETPRRPDLAEAMTCALPACTPGHVQGTEWSTVNVAE